MFKSTNLMLRQLHASKITCTVKKRTAWMASAMRCQPMPASKLHTSSLAWDDRLPRKSRRTWYTNSLCVIVRLPSPKQNGEKIRKTYCRTSATSFTRWKQYNNLSFDEIQRKHVCLKTCFVIGGLVEQEHAHGWGKTDEECEEEDGQVRCVHVLEHANQHVHGRRRSQAERNMFRMNGYL